MSLKFLDSVARSRPKYLLALVGLAVASPLAVAVILLLHLSSHSSKVGTVLVLLMAGTFSQLLAFRRLGHATSLGVTWRALLAFVAGWAALALLDGQAFFVVLIVLHVVALITGRSRAAAPQPAAAVSPVPAQAQGDPAPEADEPLDMFIKRKGWQMPGLQRKAGASTGLTNESPPAPHFSTMKGAVFGHVRNKEQVTLSAGRSSVPIVTLRIERNDPHAGLDFVSIVRLEGPSAVGFADLGDMVEATGRRQSAYVLASRCINHTTGAIYGQSFGIAPLLQRAIPYAVGAAVVVVLFVHRL